MLSVRDGAAKVNLQWALRSIFQHVILRGDDTKSSGGIAMRITIPGAASETCSF
jgi:hypothetical protein